MPLSSDVAATHRPHPLSQAELARRVQRTRQSVGEALAGPLALAKLPGARVDAAHPAVLAWAAERGVSAAVLLAPFSVARALESAAPNASTVASAQRSPEPLPTTAGTPELVDLMDLTVRQVVGRFGSLTGFTDWLDAAKKIADTRRVQLQNEFTEGKLIARELVRTHVFSHIEASHRRLLQDAATTIARRLYAGAKSGAPVEEAESMVREIMSSHLRPVKTMAARVLREPLAREPLK